MRKIICDESYMDMVLANEMEICCDLDLFSSDLDKTELNEKIVELEHYYKVFMSSEKWHKPSKANLLNINILTEEQKKSLDWQKLIHYFNDLKNFYTLTKSLINLRKIIRLSNKKEEKLTDEEYRLYLKELRLYDENIDFQDTLECKKKRVPLLRFLMKASKLKSGISIHRMNIKMPQNPDKRPVIFVVTHVGKDDQIVFSNFVKEHYTVLSGDYESLHNRIEGIVTQKNGVIYFDMNSKRERKEVIERVSQKLKAGDNILCSMEAAWDLSANCLVNEFFVGMLIAAKEANALILPVGIEMFDRKTFGFNIAENYFDPNSYKMSDFESDKIFFLNMAASLRNVLADIKFQLYFHQKINKKIQTKRTSIGDFDAYNEKFKNSILADWTFSEEDINKKRFLNKEEPNYAFQYLITKYNNIFTLYEKLKDDKIELDDRIKIIARLKNLLIELVTDLNNSVYPNSIKLQLSNIYTEIISIFSMEEESIAQVKQLKKLL